MFDHSTDYWDFNCPIHTTGLCRRLGLTRPLAMKKERFCVVLAEASGRKPSMATQLQWQHPRYWYPQLNAKYEEEASGFLFSTAGEEWQSGTHLRISLNREQFKVSIGWVQFNWRWTQTAWTIAPGQSEPNAEGQASTLFNASSLLSHLKGKNK